MARIAILTMICVSALCAEALTFSNRFRSPRNPERRIRRSTSLVVLHTTEAHARSSLNKLSERGEAHYCVVENGTVYRIIDRDREAFHAGSSMWNGRENCDSFSIGIEVVGYHNKPVTPQQIAALRELLSQLKRAYSLSDAQIVCHSHVAFGNPNRWHNCRHRGRKRCGMLFATASVRRRLGLSLRPATDPDVNARRLKIGDPYLHEVLYGRREVVKLAAEMPAAAKRPNAVIGFVSRLFSGEKAAEKDPPKEKSGVRSKEKPNKTAAKPVTKPAAKPKPKPEPQPEPEPPPTKAPGFRKGRLVVVTGNETSAPAPSSATPAPTATPAPPSVPAPTTAPPADPNTPRALQELVASGVYLKGGPIRPDYGPMRIAGREWKSPGTYYLYRGQVTPGNRIDPSKLAPGTYIFYRKR